MADTKATKGDAAMDPKSETKAELADAVEAATAEGNPTPTSDAVAEVQSELRDVFTLVVTDERGRRIVSVECDTYDDAVLRGLSALKDPESEFEPKSFSINKRFELA